MAIQVQSLSGICIYRGACSLMEQFGHPAVCPVEIPYRSMQAYSGSGASIFEPFGGSGTTLIAAEKASRKAYLMELNPAYCDVIVSRWQNLTGEKATRIAD